MPRHSGFNPDLKKQLDRLRRGRMPKHIAVVMDGNGRWAKGRGLKRAEGHRKGADAVDALVDASLYLKIRAVSLYAFSTENWSRPKTEITHLFRILDEYIAAKLPRMMRDGIRFLVSGDVTRLPASSRRLIAEGLEATAENNRMTVNFCLNYGGRDEILRAVNLILEERQRSGALKKPVTAVEFEKKLYTSSLPEVDLFIRTSGEQRISNFLLYQIAYAELVFTGVNWPDFDERNLMECIEEYQGRKRRFGGL